MRLRLIFPLKSIYPKKKKVLDAFSISHFHKFPSSMVLKKNIVTIINYYSAPDNKIPRKKKKKIQVKTRDQLSKDKQEFAAVIVKKR